MKARAECMSSWPHKMSWVWCVHPQPSLLQAWRPDYDGDEAGKQSHHTVAQTTHTRLTATTQLCRSDSRLAGQISTVNLTSRERWGFSQGSKKRQAIFSVWLLSAPPKWMNQSWFNTVPFSGQCFPVLHIVKQEVYKRIEKRFAEN